MKKLEIELTDDEWLTLQMKQYRNGETLSDTLLRLSRIRNKGDSKPHTTIGGRMGTWKYGMIKVAEEHGEDVCELVELYSQFGLISGPYISFCRPFLTSLKCLQVALKDVERDGINTWFWENGTFSWNQDEYFWNWKPNKEESEE